LPSYCPVKEVLSVSLILKIKKNFRDDAGKAAAA
jgi:hypothetical protein